MPPSCCRTGGTTACAVEGEPVVFVGVGIRSMLRGSERLRGFLVASCPNSGKLVECFRERLLLSSSLLLLLSENCFRVVRPVLCIHKYFLRRYQSRPPITASSVVQQTTKTTDHESTKPCGATITGGGAGRRSGSCRKLGQSSDKHTCS